MNTEKIETYKKQIESYKGIELGIYGALCGKCECEVEPKNNAAYFMVIYNALQRGANPVNALLKFTDNPLNRLHSLSGRRDSHLKATNGCKGDLDAIAIMESKDVDAAAELTCALLEKLS